MLNESATTMPFSCGYQQKNPVSGPAVANTIFRVNYFAVDVSFIKIMINRKTMQFHFKFLYPILEAIKSSQTNLTIYLLHTSFFPTGTNLLSEL